MVDEVLKRLGEAREKSTGDGVWDCLSTFLTPVSICLSEVEGRGGADLARCRRQLNLMQLMATEESLGDVARSLPAPR